jgi:hypothetical protein
MSIPGDEIEDQETGWRARAFAAALLTLPARLGRQLHAFGMSIWSALNRLYGGNLIIRHRRSSSCSTCY